LKSLKTAFSSSVVVVLCIENSPELQPAMTSSHKLAISILSEVLTMNSGELKVNVPLASVESDFEDHPGDSGSSLNTHTKAAANPEDCKLRARSAALKKQTLVSPRLTNLDHGGGDSMAGSLEDLVNSFDEKLTMCFQDYQEQVDKIAPVQVIKYVLRNNMCVVVVVHLL
jgi:hypothetical protein